LRNEEIQHSTTTNILRCVLEQKVHDSQNARTLPRRIKEDANPASSHDAIGFARAVEFMAGR
jgi:hypothetical protein